MSLKTPRSKNNHVKYYYTIKTNWNAIGTGNKTLLVFKKITVVSITTRRKILFLHVLFLIFTAFSVCQLIVLPAVTFLSDLPSRSSLW